MQAQAILEALRKVQESGTSITTETLADYGLDNVDCQKCNNTGVLVTKKEDGTIYARECECMAKRRSLRRIKNSGLADMLLRYDFESYETPDEQRRKAQREDPRKDRQNPAKASLSIAHPSTPLLRRRSARK